VGGARIFERGATTHTQKWQTLTTMDAAAAAVLLLHVLLLHIRYELSKFI
jgi:hypothetical protein